MNESSDEILLLNSKLSEQISESIQIVSNSLQKTKYKKTGKSLLSYIPKGGYINNAILDCYISRNPYAVGILFRSMVEHSFRHLYIYTRALNDDSDLVGEEYYGKLKGSEDLEAIAKINNYNNIVHPDKTKWNLKDEHNKSISEVGRKFNISKIFVYLIENFPQDKSLVRDGMSEYLLERLRQYTNFSSSVHGGPYAEMVQEKLLMDKEQMIMQIKSLTRESFGLYKGVVESTYLFASLFDSEIDPYLNRIQNIDKN